jgi:hypothetical protein
MHLGRADVAVQAGRGIILDAPKGQGLHLRGMSPFLFPTAKPWGVTLPLPKGTSSRLSDFAAQLSDFLQLRGPSALYHTPIDEAAAWFAHPRLPLPAKPRLCGRCNFRSLSRRASAAIS